MPLLNGQDHDFVEPPDTLFDLSSINFTSSGLTENEPNPSLTDSDVDMASGPPSCPGEPLPLEDLPGLQDDLVILETFHPRRKRPSITTSLDKILSESVVLEPEDDDKQDDPSWYRPWAPFRTRADFELAERFTVQHMSDDDISVFLRALGPDSGKEIPNEDPNSTYERPYVWHAGQSFVTMQSKKAYYDVMEKARAHLVKVYIHFFTIHTKHLTHHM
jgi:hypothetical protein